MNMHIFTAACWLLFLVFGHVWCHHCVSATWIFLQHLKKCTDRSIRRQQPTPVRLAESNLKVSSGSLTSSRNRSTSRSKSWNCERFWPTNSLGDGKKAHFKIDPDTLYSFLKKMTSCWLDVLEKICFRLQVIHMDEKIGICSNKAVLTKHSSFRVHVVPISSVISAHDGSCKNELWTSWRSGYLLKNDEKCVSNVRNKV